MHKKNLRFFLTGLAAAMSLFMIYLVVVTSLKSNLFEVLPELNAQPWFVTTIVDFYFNITLISIWVLYKEKSLIAGITWVVSFILLGSITTCLYLALQLLRLRPGQTIEQVLLRRADV